MHGLVLKELKGYVTAELEDVTWEETLETAGVEPTLYLPVSRYPDEEGMALIESAAELSSLSREELLESFGRELAPALLKTFGAHVKDDWDALDVLGHLDEQIGGVLVAEDDEGTALESARWNEETAVVLYRSSLRLDPLVRGVVDGIAEERGEPVAIRQDGSLAEGDDECELTISIA